MNILFAIGSTGYFYRNKEIIRELCARGHKVTALFEKGWGKEIFMEIELPSFLDEVNNFDCGEALERKDFWRPMLFSAREIQNYRKYLPMVQDPPAYRRRRFNFLPFWLRLAVKIASRPANFLISSGWTGHFLNFLEKAAPPDKKIVADLKNRKADLVVAMPVNMTYFSGEVEYLKAAVFLGLPTVTLIFSWDNLTTKGYFPILANRILVWNKYQTEDAFNFQNIPYEKIRITGAPVFESWFLNSGSSARNTRADFCKKHGLREDAPIFTYLGSSGNIASDEVWLIKKLRENFDISSEKKLRGAQIIVRPHPANFKHYAKLEGMDGIALVPRKGELPGTDESFRLFYDTLCHSEGVFGINTSGMVDAVIFGKPVIAVMVEEYKSVQMNTKHFRYLLESGAIEPALSFEACAEAARRILAGRDERYNARLNFVKDFIRPRGPASKAAADEILNLWKEY